MVLFALTELFNILYSFNCPTVEGYIGGLSAKIVQGVPKDLGKSITINGVNMKSNDEITNNIGVFYLLKSVELGNKDAELFSREIFEIAFLPQDLKSI